MLYYKYQQARDRRMERLAAMRPFVDKRAIYDVNSQANLINTVKYSKLFDAIWAVVSLPNQEFNQLRPVEPLAAKTLVYAKTIYTLWLTDAWNSVFYSVDPCTDFYSFKSRYVCKHGCDKYQTEFEWLTSPTGLILDNYAAQGTQPMLKVLRHFITIREHPAYSQKKFRDVKVLRNLHRFLDAVTLYAYWTVMQTYELWGERLMTQRLEIALHDDRYIEYLGKLSTLPKACLENIYKHL